MSGTEDAPKKKGWFARLKDGLSRSTKTLTGGVTGIFTKKKLTPETIAELEELLISADLGVDLSERLAAAVGKGRYDKEISDAEVREILAREIAAVLAPVEKPLLPDARPYVVLVVGVNGAGKTTTIGKLGQRFAAEGKRVVFAAGDTFRAAAVEQLRIWGERIGAAVVARPQGADAAALAYEAYELALARDADVLLIDTAGRLQNKAGLMAELQKIVRVLKKRDAALPHATILVLDATVGGNALSQAETFRDMAGATGLVMTKLDGTAKGGVLVALADRFKLPIHAIGVGESADDLQTFSAQGFARALTGADEAA